MIEKVAICVFVTFFMIVAPTIEAEEQQITVNSVEIMDISINPELNITYFDDYNITVTVNSSVPVHTVEWHKEFIDGETGDNSTHYYVNGTHTPRTTPYGWHDNLTYTENNGTFNTVQRPDQLYPEITFGLNRDLWYNVPQDIPIWQQNYQIFHFENPFTMTHNTSLFYEFNAVPNSLSPPTSQQLGVYIVERNHTIDFFETDWWTTDSVELMDTFIYSDVPHHQHTENSSHYLVTMGTNNDSTIGTNHLDVNGDFWMVLVCNANSISKGWTLKWHGTEIDNNSAHWYVGNRQTLLTSHHEGVPDTHVHIARRDGIVDGVNVSFKITNALNETTELYQEFYFGELQNIAPSTTAFYPYVGGIHSGEINISWYPSNDPNGDNVYYTLELIDSEYNSILVIAENISETYSVFDTTVVENGVYDLRIRASDGELYSEFYLSDQHFVFEIDNPTLFEYMILLILAVAPVIIIFALINGILKDVGKINEEK